MTATQSAELIRLHEGLSHTAYDCPAGKKTIGYGRNLDDVGITTAEAELLLLNDVGECRLDLENFRFWRQLSSDRRAALTDMRYNLGPSRFRQFKKMIAALDAKDYIEAASQMMNSKWARQVKGRALRLSRIIKTGRIER